MFLENITLGYLGISYAQQYGSMSSLFRSVNKDLHLYEGSWLNALGHQAQTGSVRALYYKLCGVQDKEYRQRLGEYYREHEVNCILAYWGTNPVADAISIKKYRPETTIILNILCHPIGLTSLRIRLQNLMLQRSLKYFDGLVYPSDVMRQYFAEYLPASVEMPSLVLPPLLPGFSGSGEKIVQCGHTPNILFLGRMDWWDGQATDNVSQYIEALMASGIHVYHSDKTGQLPRHDYRHTFHPMTVHDLRLFASQFDASLVIYNLAACKRDDRFRNTIPDRLIASVAFGIPVAIPRRGYDACREFLKDYGAVIEFDTPEELKTVLSNREKIRRLKDLAGVNSRKYALENHAGRLFRFIENVCRNKGRRKEQICGEPLNGLGNMERIC